MPYINIRLGTEVTNIQKQKLYTEITRLMNTIMKKNPEVTVVHIEETKPQNFSVGAVQLSSDKPICGYIDIKITKNTNTPNEKSKMISQVNSLLSSTFGIMQEALYIVIDEFEANSWGYNGKTQFNRMQRA